MIINKIHFGISIKLLPTQWQIQVIERKEKMLIDLISMFGTRGSPCTVSSHVRHGGGGRDDPRAVGSHVWGFREQCEVPCRGRRGGQNCTVKSKVKKSRRTKAMGPWTVRSHVQGSLHSEVAWLKAGLVQ